MSAEGEQLVRDAARDLLGVIEQARLAVEPIAASVAETPAPTYRIAICEGCGPVDYESTEVVGEVLDRRRCLRPILRGGSYVRCHASVRIATVREVREP